MKKVLLLVLSAMLLVGCNNKKVEKVEKVESDPVTVSITFKNSTDSEIQVKATYGVDAKDVITKIAAGESKVVESNSHANSGTDFIIIPGLIAPQSIAQPSPQNGQYRTTYQYFNNAMNCVYWNASGAPMDGTIYSDDNNWKYTTEWASDPAKQVGNPLVNSVEIKAVPCVTSTVSGIRVCK
ncbi:hypothetical protein N9L94_01105 [Robiginitalea sp.]|nr:hypothetical protein [Robiginitalea sp.]